jgi:hypothetical protein
MTLTRYLAYCALGVGLTAAALAACSAVDPNPPNPHLLPDPAEDDSLRTDALDGGAPDASEARSP